MYHSNQKFLVQSFSNSTFFTCKLGLFFILFFHFFSCIPSFLIILYLFLHIILQIRPCFRLYYFHFILPTLMTCFIFPYILFFRFRVSVYKKTIIRILFMLLNMSLYIFYLSSHASSLFIIILSSDFIEWVY